MLVLWMPLFPVTLNNIWGTRKKRHMSATMPLQRSCKWGEILLVSYISLWNKKNYLLYYICRDSKNTQIISWTFLTLRYLTVFKTWMPTFTHIFHLCSCKASSAWIWIKVPPKIDAKISKKQIYPILPQLPLYCFGSIFPSIFPLFFYFSCICGWF